MTETKTLEEFRAKFRVKELKILENRSWPIAAIRGVEILARRTSASGWKAAIEPDLSGKLHSGDKHRITKSISRNFKKK